MLAAGLGATTTAASAAPASASSVPVIYATFGNWRSPTVEPRNMDMGAFFVLRNMLGTRWNGSFAKAGGTDQWSNGAAGKVHSWPSTITLYRVRTQGPPVLQPDEDRQPWTPARFPAELSHPRWLVPVMRIIKNSAAAAGAPGMLLAGLASGPARPARLD